MRPRWAALTPLLCLLPLPSALPVAWLPPANSPGLEGRPGRCGNFSPGAGGGRGGGSRETPVPAGTAREQRGGRRRGSSGNAVGWRGAGGTRGSAEDGGLCSKSTHLLPLFILFILFHYIPRASCAGCCPAAPGEDAPAAPHLVGPRSWPGRSGAPGKAGIWVTPSKSHRVRRPLENAISKAIEVEKSDKPKEEKSVAPEEESPQKLLNHYKSRERRCFCI